MAARRGYLEDPVRGREGDANRRVQSRPAARQGRQRRAARYGITSCFSSMVPRGQKLRASDALNRL